MRDELGDRMKAYESAASSKLIHRMPVIIRLDGKAFHSYLRPCKLKSPFNNDVHALMCGTMRYLCENIQNAVFGYTQSDEISILLKDWSTLKTNQWFGGTQSKIESISAAMATGIFNLQKLNYPSLNCITKNFAMFDSRAYNVPREDVTNYFIWRQKDAIRNSVQSLGQHNFSHSQLQRKRTDEVKDMLLKDAGIDWNELDTWNKRGTCYLTECPDHHKGLDYQIPIFTEDRRYIDIYLKAEEKS